MSSARTLEFTGERVIPGQVDDDLWNEHRSRYVMAARFAAGRRVLDLGCGTGYGTALLAQQADSALGIDLSAEAIEYARQQFSSPQVAFQAADAVATSLPEKSFGLITAFEVIEHLSDPAALLAEVQRLLTPDGLALISTPNSHYYAEQRAQSGPNPFHVREFSAAEFHVELARFFAYVRLHTQNHTAGFLFRAPSEPNSVPVLLQEEHAEEVEQAHFYLAFCSQEVLPDPEAVCYLPSVGNILREREQHIQKLDRDLRQHQTWLQEARDIIAERERDLAERLLWAKKLDEEMAQARSEIVRLNTATASMVADYEQAVQEANAWGEQQQAAAIGFRKELDEKCSELARCVEILHQNEADLVERTEWALRLEKEDQQKRTLLEQAAKSRWIRLGRQIHLGPVLPEEFSR